jgi:CubicO group peptidase (beta-lactamase class C family)
LTPALIVIICGTMRSKNTTIRAVAIILLALFVAQPARSQEGPFKGFDDYANKAIRDFSVPGIAVAIVKDDKVVFAKGYGVRKLGDPTPVDEHTLFAIGSTSKAYTAAALAMLVDEGKIKWDDPVTNYLKGFQLYDPLATRELTIRDLLCHRSGLERGDFIWLGNTNDRDEILRRVRYLKPTWGFRSTFGYQNIMFLAAGQIIPAVAGRSWDDFIKERIFKPLGMNESTTSVRDLVGKSDVATPHEKVNGTVQPISYRNIDNIAPAGAINSSVAEIAQWLRLQLGNGTFEGKRLISDKSINEMRTAQTVIRMEGFLKTIAPESHLSAYGLGWFLSDMRGRLVAEHGGGIDGMTCDVAIVPEEKLGVVVLTNSGSGLSSALVQRILISYLGGPERDPVAQGAAMLKMAEGQQKAAEAKLEQARVKGTKPSLAEDQYVGTYNDDFYGDARVVRENGKLVLRYSPAISGELEHWHYDTFRATLNMSGGPKVFVTFTLNSKAQVSELIVSLMGSDLTFKRAPEKEKAAP